MAQLIEARMQNRRTNNAPTGQVTKVEKSEPGEEEGNKATKVTLIL
jgi:hypothetical protein